MSPSERSPHTSHNQRKKGILSIVSSKSYKFNLVFLVLGPRLPHCSVECNLYAEQSGSYALPTVAAVHG